MTFWETFTQQLKKQDFSDAYIQQLLKLFGTMPTENFVRLSPAKLAEAITAGWHNDNDGVGLGFMATPDDAADLLRIATKIHSKLSRQHRPQTNRISTQPITLTTNEADASPAKETENSMNFWKTHIKELKSIGFTTEQIKALENQFPDLDAAAILKNPKQVLASMPGDDQAENRKKLDALLEKVKQLQTGAGKERPTSSQASFTVSGLIIETASDKPLANVIVRAFVRKIGQEILLGETTSKKDGQYTITVTPGKNFQSVRKGFHLMVRAYTVRNTLLGSEIAVNVTTDQKLNLKVKKITEPSLTVFEQLTAKLAPMLGNQTLAELNEDDIKILAADANINPDQVVILQQSTRLARETELPAEIFHALASQKLPLELEKLLTQSDEEIQTALEAALEKNVIPAMPGGFLDSVLAQLQELRLEKGLLLRHEIGGQLLNQENDKPLAGLVVRIMDLDALPHARMLNVISTDQTGKFSFAYTAPPRSQEARSFKLEILDQQDKELDVTKVSIRPDQVKLDPMRIRLPILESPSPRITELNEKLKLELSPLLLKAWDEHGFLTLADIRKAGGIDRLVARLTEKPADKIARILEAHAYLNVLSSDIQDNAILIEKGYTNIQAIARKTQPEFVNDLHDKLGDFKAAQLHVQARAQVKFLGNVLTGLRADLANGFANPLNTPALQSQFPPQCGYRECDAAVSPAAYLADLFDYAVTYVKNNNAPIDLHFLETTFLQPFGDLPASCEAMEEQVRQVRICIEVLRRYLGRRPLKNSSAEQVLTAAEKDYRLSAYTMLLNRLGTSHEEIRLARTANQSERQALANRLSVDLTPRQAASRIFDPLKELFLDTTDSNAVGEQTLEKLFGLVDTTRDPLSEGVKLYDVDNQITRWNLDGVEWNRNTDPDGAIHVSLSHPTDSVYRIELYRDHQRKDLVASGEISSVRGAVRISEEKHSGLSGIFIVNYRTAITDVEIVAVPHFLSWRLQHLRANWMIQDWLPDSYRNNQTGTYSENELLPVIDPDVIGPDDFRTPYSKLKGEDPEQPFDLWEKRHEWMNRQLQALENVKGPDGLPDLKAIIEHMKAPINYSDNNVIMWTDKVVADNCQMLETLKRNLSRSQSMEVTKKAITEDLKLTIESFNRFMEIKAAYDTGRSISTDTWHELYSILVQAQKRSLFPNWRTEEQLLEKRLGSILLGPKYFWISLREPESGDWPPSYLQQHSPIDPEIIKPNDLPRLKTGTASVVRWQAREARLNQIYQELKSERETKDFDSMLRYALGDPNPGDPLPLSLDLDTLKQDLDSDDERRKIEAIESITANLYMSVADFVRLTSIKAKFDDPDLAKPPTEQEWTEIYAILTSAQKMRREYPIWIEEEKKLPLLDPDIVALKDLPEPTVGQRAIGLWKKRQKQLQESYDKLKNTLKTSGFEAMLEHALDKPFPLPSELNFDTLKENLVSRDQTVINNARFQITTRLYMTVEDFEQLIKIRARDAAPDPESRPTDKEWESVCAILTQIYKLKRMYPVWSNEEKNFVYWHLLKVRLPKWRASTESRQNWQQALQNRSCAPHIDPDVIGPEYIRDTVVTGPVSNLWNERSGWIRKQREQMNTIKSSEGGLASFDAVLIENIFEQEARERIKAKYRPSNTASALLPFLKEAFNTETTDLLKFISENQEKMTINAQKGIKNDLYLTPQDSQDLKSIYLDAVSNSTVSETQRDMISEILTRAMLVASVIGLRKEEAAGPNSARLEQFSLPRNAFSYLLRARDLLANKETLLNSEWEDVFNILVQVRKRRNLADWRQKERELKILLGPDHFKITEPPTLEFPPPEPKPLPVWRATWRDRRDWQDRLKARIEQQQSVIEALRSAVNIVEEATLPKLRKSLIMVTNAKGNDLAAKAKWLTNHLLIDVAAGSCQMTTRIGQAIETMQGLLWSLRTEQLKDTYPKLLLQTDNFDEEWHWIGSYATWRAAMMVFLYPENILLPNLRKHQTPVFRKLVEQLRANPTLTPKQVCKAAKDYSDYFRDVSNLSIEATCQTRTRISIGNCQSKETEEDTYHNLFYMFARSEVTGNVYWSAYNPIEQSGYAQTFWEKVPGLEGVTTIVGAVPYAMSTSERNIFLFTRSWKVGEDKLEFTKYHLEQTLDRWNSEPTQLEPPPVSIEVVLTTHIPGEKEPPTLVFHSQNGFYIRPLNLTGATWKTISSSSSKDTSESEWDIFKISVMPSMKKLHEVHDHYYYNPSLPSGHRSVHGWWISFTNKNNDLIIGVITPDEIQYQVFTEVKNFGKCLWIGALSNRSVIYVFFDEYGGKPKLQPIRTPAEYESEYRLEGNKTNTGAVNPFNTLIGLATIVPVYGVEDFGNVVINKVLDVNASDQCLAIFSPPENLHKLRGVAPRTQDFLEITQGFSGAEVAVRRELIQSIFQRNFDSSQSTLTYLEEAYYFVPIYLALMLHRSGEYITALHWFRTVYDYSQPEGSRKIFYGLEQEKLLTEIFKRSNNWLLDPLNPHEIASTRGSTYTRFTLLSLVRCLLDYADAEFTRDTAESIPRARKLYMTALELLDLPGLNQRLGNCENVIGEFLIEVGDEDPQWSTWQPVWLELLRSLRGVHDYARFKAAVENLKEVLKLDEPWRVRIKVARTIVAQAQAMTHKQPSFQEIIAEGHGAVARAQVNLLTQPLIVETAKNVGTAASKDFLHGVSLVSDLNKSKLSKEHGEIPLLSGELALARSRYNRVPSYHFCIPPNPIIRAFRLRAELNLYKLRNCRNIAGMERPTEPYAAPTDSISGMPDIGGSGQLILPRTIIIQPTLYRYESLIQRAKQLVELARQMETAFMSALQNRDTERYSLLKARQDARLAHASIQLQDLRVREAESGVNHAELQKDRVEFQRDYYQQLLESGLSLFENLNIILQETAVAYSHLAALASSLASLIHTTIGATKLALTSGVEGGSDIAAAFSSQASGASSLASSASTQASVFATLANYERRSQDWAFQRDMSSKEIHIYQQQIRMANDHTRVVVQERQIAAMQSSHADEVIEFLNNKFTDVELFDWMSGILAEVYSFFLQQATAMARLAESQLAFQRQEVPPALIQADYWEAPRDGALVSNSDGNAADRRGLTGSARLLQDIYRLDQHAFETDKRKLQLTKIISLARMAPFEFQQFRETGIMIFATPLELFDRDYPGHYLRLIKRVRTSVIALIPPTLGIHATLSTSGISRVVIGGDLFQTTIVRRDPESVALTAPQNATGLFDLETQSDMLFPFEATGVDTTWEFRMPKAANFFDYRTIADVLITIEYTALDSSTYRQQVIQQLDNTVSADRPFSFRHQFADAWYDLHHPDLVQGKKQPMTVSFTTRREDFPPNINDLQIAHVTLYFARKPNVTTELNIRNLHFFDQNGDDGHKNPDGSENSATTLNGMVRIQITEKSPVGKWTLALEDKPGIRKLFEDDQIEDILFVITFGGKTAEWPQ